jgi:hypothetical protein
MLVVVVELVYRNNAFIVVLHLEVTRRPSTMNGGWLRNSKI